jgi:4-hydroxy-tetrahydrodipicolinate synthase
MVVIPVSGVFAACVTGRTENPHGLDLAATLDIVDFVHSHGVDGVALLGATGEFLDFDTTERRHLIEAATRRGRTPVIANVSHPSLDGAVQLAKASAAAGVKAVLLMPPPFFKYPADDLRRFYLEFAARTDPALTRLIYNIPFFTGAVPIDVAEELLVLGAWAGIKDSSGNPAYLQRLLGLRANHEFSLLVGNDTLFSFGNKRGADGAISGVACAVPELLVGLRRALAGSEPGKAERLDAALHEFIEKIDVLPAPLGIRVAMALRGFQAGAAACPAGSENMARIEALKRWFPGWLERVQGELR